MTQKLSRHCAILAAALSLGGTFASSLSAESVATKPVGAMTYSFPATGVAAVSSMLSVPLNNPPVFTGPVASFTSNQITVAGTPFQGNLAAAGSPFFVRFLSGALSGRTILVTANTTNSLTVDVTDNTSPAVSTNLDAVGFALANGDQFEVIVGDTLSSLLGDGTAQNPLVFVSAAIAAQADTIGFYNKGTAKIDTYFFSTGTNAWRSATSAANANNKIIYPDDGFTLTRRANRAAVSFTVVGNVPTTVSKLKVVGGNKSITTTTGFPADITLGQLNLTNWAKNNVVSLADSIQIFNPATAKRDTYFQRADNIWRKVGDLTNSDQGLFVLPAGGALTITKRTAVTGASSYIAAAQLPYSL